MFMEDALNEYLRSNYIAGEAAKTGDNRLDENLTKDAGKTFRLKKRRIGKMDIPLYNINSYIRRSNMNSLKRYTMIYIALFIAMFLLSACGCKHDFTDATCTVPKTCIKCGMTEGDAIGHNWANATCTEPQICTICGEKQGDALGHDASPVTVLEDSVCTICGEILEKALGFQIDSETNGYGYMNREGKVVIPFDYDYAYQFSDGLALVFKGSLSSSGYPDKGKYGYIDETGTVIIPFEYTEGNSFRNGYAVVEKDGKPSLIDKNGNKVAAFEGYDYLEYFPTHEMVLAFNGTVFYGYAFEGVYTFFSIDGEEIFKGEFEDIYAYDSHGYVDVTQNEKHALFTFDGTQTTEYYDDLGTFSDTDDLIAFKQGGKYGYLDLQGNEVIAAQFDDSSRFFDGHAVVEKDDKFCLIDTSGTICMTFEYDHVESTITDGRLIAFEGTTTSYGFPEKGYRFLIDLEGNQIGDKYYSNDVPLYSIYQEKLWKVQNNDTWAVTDLDGNIVVPFIECDSLQIGGDLIAVRKNGAYQVMDYSGTPINEIQWDDVKLSDKDLIPVQKLKEQSDFRNAKWGMTIDEITEQEGRTPDYTGNLSGTTAEYIGYNDILMGNDVIVAYYFGKNGLYEARYIWTEEHSNDSLYINDYNDVKAQLIKKYGEPRRDKESWDSDRHKEYYSDEKGNALSYGYLSYNTEFSTARTDISMQMSADNYTISFVIYYCSKIIEQPSVDYSNDF